MNESSLRRRELLALLGSGSAAGLAGCAGLLPGDGGASTPTGSISTDRAQRLAERFAPQLYFDAAETWFPTDPRPYVSEQDGDQVVSGFDAVDGYIQRSEEQGKPPDPTVFYNVLTYPDTPLSVVQFWFYSVFDQFTTNFHWHDWEVLHVFVDDESDEPQLYVASAHAEKVPNNEFLDPQGPPRILAELGSHSSGVSLNSRPSSFQRFPIGSLPADVTNDTINAIDVLTDFPIAYGLPRDEGRALPYVIPELDGTPIHEHPDLPNLKRDHLAPSALTVRSFDDLSTPPAGLRTRETGPTFGYEDDEVDYEYELVPTDRVENIMAFTGPQLSFEFEIPKFAEEAIATHLTAPSPPWTQSRYQNPIEDVTDTRHRAALAERYGLSPSGLGTQLVGLLQDVVPNEDAPDGEGVTTAETTVESVALVESEPVAVPSFRGILAVQDLPEGTHRLTVNTAGKAPYAEQIEVGAGGSSDSQTTTESTTSATTGTSTADTTTEASTAETSTADTTTETSTTNTATSTTASATTERPTATAGVNGRIGLVANESAAKLQMDPTTVDADLHEFTVADDFGGKLYTARVDGPDAVYVHENGAYTAEVVDKDGGIGAFRVNHDLESGRSATIDHPQTGKASLATFLADLAAETQQTIREATDDGIAPGVRGLVTALDAVRAAAERAATQAESGAAASANARLRAVQTRLSKVRDALATVQDAIPEGANRATERRLAQAETRVEQAIASEKL